MYMQHYGLSRKPFDISPDPDFLWLGEKHEEGLATLKYGILDNKGYLMITGDVGTGKTALIRAIEREIRDRIIPVVVTDPNMALLDFLNYLAFELNLGRTFASKGEFLIGFRQFLRETVAAGRRVLLIVDEAQRLTGELLEEIRLLSSVDVRSQIAVNTFFVGQLEFNELLYREENRAVRQRICVSYQLTPLTAGETGQYVEHRLKVAGAARAIFTPQAIRVIHECTRGYPRLINILCDHALMSGYAQEVREVGEDIVRECARELELTMGPTGRRERAPDAAPTKPDPGESKPSAPVAAPAAQGRSREWAVALAAAVLIVMAGGWLLKGQIHLDTLFASFTAKTGVAATAQPGNSGGQGDTQPSPATSGSEPPPIDDAAPAATAPPSAPAAVASAGAPIGVPPLELDADDPQPEPPVVAALAAADVAPVKAQDLLQQKEFTIYFTRSSAEIPIYAHDMLFSTVYILSSLPGARATIEGHTDASGDPGLNMAISAERANTVKAYLVRQGIAPERLVAAGYGADKPVDSNSTPEGKGRNRRVVIRINRG